MIIFDKAGDLFKEVPISEAQQGILSGAYLPQNQQIPMLIGDGSGDIYDADPRSVGKFLQDGYQIAAPDEVLTFEARDDDFLAVGLAAADRLTAGLTNAATQGLESAGMLVPGTADEMRAVRRANPYAYAIGGVLGEAAGMFGPGMLLKGGTALLAKGALKTGFSKEMLEITGAGLSGFSKTVHAATFAPRMVDRVSVGVGKAVLGRFGKGAATATVRNMDAAGRTGMAAQAGRLAVKGAAGAARFGSEGIVYGAMDGLSEADFGDPDVAAAQILAGIGTHGVYGGVFGLAGGATFTLGKKVAGRLWEMSTGGRGAFSKWRDKRYKEQAPDNLKDLLDDPKRAQTLFSPELRKNADAQLSEGLRASNAAMREATELKGIEGILSIKRGDLSTRTENYARVLNSTQALLDDMKTAGGNMSGEWQRGVRAINKEMNDTAGDYVQRLAALQKADVQLKALLGTADKVGPDAKQIKSLLVTTRDMLSDPKLWGKKAVGLLKEADVIRGNAVQSNDAMRKLFMKQVAAGSPEVPDPKLMTEFIDNYSDAWQDTTGMQINVQLRSMGEYAAQLKKYKKSPALTRTIERLGRAEKTLGKAYDNIRTNLADHNALRSMDSAMEGSALVNNFSELKITGLIGAAGRNPLAAAVGVSALGGSLFTGAGVAGIAGGFAARSAARTYRGVQNPVGFYMRKGQLEAERLAATGHMDSGFQRLLKKGLAKAKIVAPPPPITRRMWSAGLTAFAKSKSSQDRRDAHEESLAEMRKITEHPELVGEKVAENLGLTAEEMPNISNAMAMKIVKNAAWMMENHIPPQAPATLLGRSPDLSDFELQKFGQQLLISQDPLSVVDLLVDGELTLADVQALEGMWPELYEQWHVSLLTQLSEMDNPDSLDYETRLQLGIMFQQPLDPSMQFDQILRAQEANAMITLGGQSDGQQQGPTNGPALMSDGLQTRSAESIMAGATDMDQTAQRRTN